MRFYTSFAGVVSSENTQLRLCRLCLAIGTKLTAKQRDKTCQDQEFVLGSICRDVGS